MLLGWLVDPGLVGQFRCVGPAVEPVGVGGVGRVEGGLALLADLLGGAVVHRRWGVPADPGMSVLVVVSGEEAVAESSRVGERPEPCGEVRHVFHGLELGLGVGVVVRGPGPGM